MRPVYIKSRRSAFLFEYIPFYFMRFNPVRGHFRKMGFFFLAFTGFELEFKGSSKVENG